MERGDVAPMSAQLSVLSVGYSNSVSDILKRSPRLRAVSHWRGLERALAVSTWRKALTCALEGDMKESACMDGAARTYLFRHITSDEPAGGASPLLDPAACLLPFFCAMTPKEPLRRDQRLLSRRRLGCSLTIVDHSHS